MSAPTDWDEDGQGHVEGHPIPLRYERDGRFVRFNSGGYIAPIGESTSARLRRVEQERDEIKQAFAASQADLTAAKAEGDRIAARLMDTTVELKATRREMAETFRRAGLAVAELASARAELEQLRKNEEIRAHVIRERNAELKHLRELVTTCQVTTCARCRSPIWCAEPREPMPGATGYFQHVHCPDKEQTNG